jgi:catalase
MTPKQQACLINNIVDSLRHAPAEIQARQLQHFYKADNKYGRGVEMGLEKSQAAAT